jgi:hypothetical protein
VIGLRQLAKIAVASVAVVVMSGCAPKERAASVETENQAEATGYIIPQREFDEPEMSDVSMAGFFNGKGNKTLLGMSKAEVDEAFGEEGKTVERALRYSYVERDVTVSYDANETVIYVTPKINEVRPGMTKAEVEAVLGAESQEVDGEYAWTVYGDETWLSFSDDDKLSLVETSHFSSGAVADWSMSQGFKPGEALDDIIKKLDDADVIYKNDKESATLLIFYSKDHKPVDGYEDEDFAYSVSMSFTENKLDFIFILRAAVDNPKPTR